MARRTYYVYILASLSGTLYVGVTNNLDRRGSEHRQVEDKSSFTARYRVPRLVYFEEYHDAHGAIRREKQIKLWRRAKKVTLIEASNPDWSDLSPTVPCSATPR